MSPLRSIAVALILLASCTATPQDPEPPVPPVRFSDVREETGLGSAMRGFRMTWVEADGDGYPDVSIVLPDAQKRDQYLLLLNRPAGDSAQERIFWNVTQPSGLLQNRTEGAQGRQVSFASFADVDNDGDADAVMGAYTDESWEDSDDRSEVLLQESNARFTLAPASDLQGTPPMTTSGSAFLDFNGDAKLDLVTIYWYRDYPKDYKEGRRMAHPIRLWKGGGDGTFTDVTRAAGMWTVEQPGLRNSARPTYGVTPFDYDNDGDLDILQGCYGRNWNSLWRNNGDGTFTDVAQEAGIDGDDIADPGDPPDHANGNTFCAAPADFDQDGDLDVFLATVTHSRAPGADESCLLVNEGKEGGWRFRRTNLIVRERGGDGKGRWDIGDHYAAWIDYDNDGLLDLLAAPSVYFQQYLALYRQRPDRTFEEVGAELGIRIQNPEGLSVSDYDRDGDEDILVSTGPGRYSDQSRERTVHLFRNDGGNRNHWVNILLEGDGRTANRNAIGARVWVTAGGMTQMREVSGGKGHCGTHDGYDLRFGLGRATSIEELRVQWPDREGTTQSFRNVSVDSFVRIQQNFDGIDCLPRR